MLPANIAISSGADFLGVWLDAPTEILRTRASARRDDASDATVETVTAQIKEYPGSTSWYRLDASTSIDQLKVTARALFDVSLSPPRA
jgi:predicted kinase